MSKKFFLSLVFVLILPSLSFSQLTYQVNFSQEELSFQKKGTFDYIQLKNGENLEIEGKPQLPLRIFNFLIPEYKDIDTIICEAESQQLQGKFLIYPAQKKEKTDGVLLEDTFVLDSSVYFSEKPYPEKTVEIINKGFLDGNSIVTLALYPLEYLPGSQNLIFHKSLKLKIVLKDSILPCNKPISEKKTIYYKSFLSDILFNSEELISYPSFREYSSQISDQPIYLIITSEELKSSFYSLIEWKTQKGLRASLITLDSIENYYSGVDTQEKIRNFLIQTYPQGLLWVLLGGDGEVIPFRYAYHANSSSSIPVTSLQICDLYYADLDGEWDKDQDGIYGEPVDDSPDLYPELFVGRAPVRTKEEAEVFVQKIINYEKNPGSGDFSYLKKAVWISSDQMRDWDSVGQHTIVSQEVDQSFYQDLWSLAEAPSGNAENPTNPSGSKCIETLNQGWGIIGVFAHGKSNGFIASSNLINEWPKSYVLSDSGAEDGNGHLNYLNNANKLGILYSISCNQTALDVESEQSLGTPPCIGKSFLVGKDKGTVAFLGYSRWGWVSTSYKLADEFMKNLFKPEYEHHIGIAEAFSKTAYSIYRDLNYGHNLLGDPEMQIWTDIPCSLEVNYPSEKTIDDSILYLEVKARQIPLPEAKVTLSYKDTLLYTGMTNSEGKLTISLAGVREGEIYLTVTKYNYLPFESKLMLKSSSDVKDDKERLNPNYTLGQNYPNPFNPSTTIPFTVSGSQFIVHSPIHTTLTIFNILGQKVKTLVDEEKNPGNYQVIWDGKDENRNDVSSGIYFYQFKAGNYKETKKMSVLR
ncbi:MAG: C25 family cysteine peptidase [candidate division Zixibacteria bacterium]|nr:C25 family cysteine peptidase [candidate division Zixibacteria bacterium]